MCVCVRISPRQLFPSLCSIPVTQLHTAPVTWLVQICSQPPLFSSHQSESETHAYVRFSCFIGTFHRHFYTVQTGILYPQTLNQPITENFLHFYKKKKKHHLVWFLSCFNPGEQKKCPHKDSRKRILDIPINVRTFCPQNIGYTWTTHTFIAIITLLMSTYYTQMLFCLHNWHTY